MSVQMTAERVIITSNVLAFKAYMGDKTVISSHIGSVDLWGTSVILSPLR